MDNFEIKRNQINQQEQKRVIECINNPAINNPNLITYLEKLKFEETESISDYVKRQDKSEQEQFEKIFKSMEINQSEYDQINQQDNKRKKI